MTILEQESSTQNAIVKPDIIRRSMEKPGASTWSMLRNQDAVLVVLLMAAAGMLLMPASFLVSVPVTLVHYLWATGKRYRLPYRMPINWGGTDFSLPKPDGTGFRKAEAILFLGNDYTTGEQLWITNSDARRHAFILGTTGSGKALPGDALVHTPKGWVLNRDLREGDEITHPDGGTTKITSIHPQGQQKTARVEFADGRFVDTTVDHLWQVRAFNTRTGFTNQQLMTTGDLAIPIGSGQPVSFYVPLIKPIDYGRGNFGKVEGACAALNGLSSLPSRIDLQGTNTERRTFFGEFAKKRGIKSRPTHATLIGRDAQECALIKHLIWSIGGTARSMERLDEDNPARSKWTVEFNIPRFRALFPTMRVPAMPEGLEVISVRMTGETTDCICIKTGRKDGLYVTDGYVVTHNTEMLLGLASQSLMWSSGFIFVDGKGTPAFASRIWSLCKRFGREDDYRIINFTDSGGDPDAPAGGPHVQSNTMNPFAKGQADQLMNLLVSLMGDAGGGNDMWKSRAISLISGALRALVEMRNAGDILLDVQAIRDFLPLGQGVMKKSARVANSVADLTEEQWKDIRSRGGMIELYLRALNGEFSSAAKLALKGFFDTLPGFSLQKALQGEPQDTKASEQYGFLAMQLTKPLGSMADDFGHIFRTPLGEVDMEDVAYNRRILIVLLPALQKAPDEMKNCGKIVVAMVRQMMGYASGSQLVGKKKQIIDAMPTKSLSPFIIILDEIGYYMVEGVDVMMAQGRSLGFMIIPAGQDIAAMGKSNKQVAESVAANARLTAFGAMEDGNGTLEFMTKKVGQHQVAVSSGYSQKPGMFGSKLVDRQDVSFQQTTRVAFEQAQSLREGEFYFVFEGILVKSRTFYIGEHFTTEFQLNKFLRIRGPKDKVPGLDQSVEIKFLGELEAMAPRLGNLAAMLKAAKEIKQESEADDALTLLARTMGKPEQSHPEAGVEAILFRAKNYVRRSPSAAYVEDLLDDTADFISEPEMATADAPVLQAPPMGRSRPARPGALNPGGPLHGFAVPDTGPDAELHGGSEQVARVLSAPARPDRSGQAGQVLQDNDLPTTQGDPDSQADEQIGKISGILGSVVRSIAELETLLTTDLRRGQALEKSIMDQIKSVAKPAELPEQDPEDYFERLDKLSRYLEHN